MNFLQLAFIQRSLLAGSLVAALAAFLGVIVILRRMSFFSDAISHASLTGIAISLLIGISPTWGAVAFCVLVGLAVIWLSQRKILNVDAIIGVIFSGSVAFGVIVLSRLSSYRLNILNYLFGDILGVSHTDLMLAAALFIIGLTIGLVYFPELIYTSFSPDLAKVKGFSVSFWNYLFAVLLSLTIAVSIKIVGVILVAALVVIPATAAKLISRSVREMIGWSLLFGVVSVFIGLVGSYFLDMPSGPTIVMTQVVFFILAFLFK